LTVTIREVAARAGVSVGTVSNVLNGRGTVKESIVQDVRDAIAALGYVRNDAARQLRAGRSRVMGLVVLNVANPFFAAVARGAEARAADDGMVVLVGSSEQVLEREETYLDLFREQRVSGILVSPAAEDHTALDALAASGIPVVLVDRERTEISPLLSVAVDDVEGGRLAVTHLLQQGRRRIVFVGDPLTTRQVADRLEGARRAVADYPDAALEVIASTHMTVLAGRAVGETLHERVHPADAVFAANDLLAIGVMQALTMTGDLRVPDDIALVGYDDIDFAAAAIVPLTSVRQPAELIGWTAADLALRQAQGTLGAEELAVRFHPELIIRGSTAASNTAPAVGSSPVPG
jgi:LacI family transcriptional regulator